MLRFGTKRIYFPRYVLKIIRDERLPPNQFAFRVPIFFNKFDIRDYLAHVYNVNVLNVRTVLFPGKVRRHPYGRFVKSSRVKKAFVTVDQQFEYPPPPDLKDLGGYTREQSAEIARHRLRGWRIPEGLRATAASEQQNKQDQETTPS